MNMAEVIARDQRIAAFGYDPLEHARPIEPPPQPEKRYRAVSHPQQQKLARKLIDKKAPALYAAGKTDSEIKKELSKEVHISDWQVARWRKREGKKPNNLRANAQRVEKEAPALYDQKMNDNAIGRALFPNKNQNWSRQLVFRWRQRHNLPANRKGSPRKKRSVRDV